MIAAIATTTATLHRQISPALENDPITAKTKHISVIPQTKGITAILFRPLFNVPRILRKPLNTKIHRNGRWKSKSMSNSNSHSTTYQLSLSQTLGPLAPPILVAMPRILPVTTLRLTNPETTRTNMVK